MGDPKKLFHFTDSTNNNVLTITEMYMFPEHRDCNDVSQQKCRHLKMHLVQKNSDGSFKRMQFYISNRDDEGTGGMNVHLWIDYYDLAHFTAFHTQIGKFKWKDDTLVLELERA